MGIGYKAGGGRPKLTASENERSDESLKRSVGLEAVGE